MGSSRAWLLHGVVPKMLAAISVAGVCYIPHVAASLVHLVSLTVAGQSRVGLISILCTCLLTRCNLPCSLESLSGALRAVPPSAALIVGRDMGLSLIISTVAVLVTVGVLCSVSSAGASSSADTGVLVPWLVPVSVVSFNAMLNVIQGIQSYARVLNVCLPPFPSLAGVGLGLGMRGGDAKEVCPGRRP
jgi:hypothetical protein